MQPDAAVRTDKRIPIPRDPLSHTHRYREMVGKERRQQRREQIKWGGRVLEKADSCLVHTSIPEESTIYTPFPNPPKGKVSFSTA